MMKPLRRRRRRWRKRGDAGVQLPTELVLEILERATPSTAVRCAATCRPWHRLVSRRSFVRRASRPRRALLLGFFAFDHADDDEQVTLQPRFVPSPGGPAGWRCPCSPRLDLDPRCLGLDPVLSRNGYLVLRRVALAKSGDRTPTAINYCVCSPATGSCHFLPPYHVVDEDTGFWEYSCALLTGRDFNHRVSSQGTLFELVVAAIPTGRQELLVSIFSSRTMRWSSVGRSLEIPSCFTDSEMTRRYGPGCYTPERAWSDLELHPRTPPAVCDGTVCWQCTCEALGRPSASYSGGEDSDDIGGVRLLWYCEKSNVLVFSTAALGNFALDLDTKRAEALGKILRRKSESCARYACVSWRACPYEMDCPPDWISTPK